MQYLAFLSASPLNIGKTLSMDRYVTEVLKLPTTVQMQLAVSAGMRALVVAMLRVGDPANPLARRRAIDAVAGTGERGYDEAALDADLAKQAGTEIGRIAALGGQLRSRPRSGTWPRRSGSAWPTAR